jgi:DNA-binding response OmpR family regulator
MSSAKRILIVDDDAFIRRPLEFILREEGFEPFTAADGEECLSRAGNVRPDLIFLDVMMPGRDGFAVCGALKSDPELREVPVILLSARGMESDRQRGLDVGASDFMTKPYSPTDLVRRVREILRDR